MFKSKHIKLPASVADQYLLVLLLHPHSHLTPHSSLWNPVSRNDTFLVLQNCARKRQTVAQFSPEIVFSKPVWCSWNLSAIISNSPPCLTQNRQEKEKVPPVHHTRRQDGTRNKPGLCERFDQLEKLKVWRLQCRQMVAMVAILGSLHNCRNMQRLGIHQARSASTLYLWCLGKGTGSPALGWWFKENCRDGWLGSSLGAGTLDITSKPGPPKMGQDGESKSEAYRMGQKHFRVYGVKLSEAVCSSEPCRARWLNPVIIGGKSHLDSTQQGRRLLLYPPHTHTHTPDVRGKEGQVLYHLSLQSQEGRDTAGDWGQGDWQRGGRETIEGAACLSDPFSSRESVTFY